MTVSDAYLAVLGGNALAMKPIERLRAAGYRVLVIDGNPEAPAQRVADGFLHANFARTPQTLSALKDIPLCGVMPLNDFGVRTASAVAAERKLPGNSAAAAWRATNKAAMKAAWQASGLPTAHHCTIDKRALIDGACPPWDRYPCIVKPAFSGGGSRAVALVEDEEKLRQFVRCHLAEFLDDEVIIEEFVEGTEHTVEVVLWNGGARVLSISDKQNYAGSATVVQNLYFPGPVGNLARDAIEKLVIEGCRSLDLVCGAAHFEVLLREDGPLLLEVGGRPGGGINLYPICELSTGYDYPALYAAALTGRALDFARSNPTWHLAWHYFDAGEGVVSSIRGMEALRAATDVVDFEIYEREGQQRLDLRNDLARPGYVLVKAHSHIEAKRRAAELCATVCIESAPA